MLHANSELLVNTLKKLELLEGRFSSLELANVHNGEKRGNFSLVFSAFDEISGQQVAIKFFDLDPNKQNQYRLLCFEREHSILTSLKGAPRCLQVVSPYSTFQLEIPIGGQDRPFTIPAPFFATDWFEDDVDDFFNNQDSIAALEKLKIFNELVLAVESLHFREVFHRDLKTNNFRSRRENGKREVIAIDLGTAARVGSQPIIQSYGDPVGFLMYSAPEAFCGFAGNRTIAPLTDIFALGCMLFELFHPDDYPSAYRTVNPEFDLRFSALRTRIDLSADDDGKLLQWDLEAPRLLGGLSPVTLSEFGSSAPLAIAELLTELISQMTAPNFRQRCKSFSKIRQRIWVAIRVMQHEALQKRRIQIANQKRAERIAKAEARANNARLRAQLLLEKAHG